MRFILSIILSFWFMSGCSTHKPQTSMYDRPSWIMNPSIDGRIGAVGSAYIHHKGISYQRKVAIDRALEELSIQKGATISLSDKKTDIVINDRQKSNFKRESHITSSNSVTAHIEKTWKDPISQEFFVWMLMD